jgi:hypothetical protein
MGRVVVVAVAAVIDHRHTARVEPSGRRAAEMGRRRPSAVRGAPLVAGRGCGDGRERVGVFSADNVTLDRRVGVLALPFPPSADRCGDSAIGRAPVVLGVGAGEVEGSAGGGAVGGAGAAGNAGRHRLVVAPAVAVGTGGLRYIRYIRDMAGQPCSGWVKAVRYIRYKPGRCSGCSGWGLAIRYMPVAGLICEFGRL